MEQQTDTVKPYYALIQSDTQSACQATKQVSNQTASQVNHPFNQPSREETMCCNI